MAQRFLDGLGSWRWLPTQVLIGQATDQSQQVSPGACHQLQKTGDLFGQNRPALTFKEADQVPFTSSGLVLLGQAWDDWLIHWRHRLRISPPAMESA